MESAMSYSLLDVASFEELSNSKCYEGPYEDDNQARELYISNTVYSLAAMTPTNA